MKKISIITVCYNSKNTIQECIESVNRQTYPEIEHIIIDGASTDGTFEIIKECKIRGGALISEKDEGIYHAMNKGLGLANGSIIHFLNSDDSLADEHVISDIALEFDRVKPVIVCCNVALISRTKRKIRRLWNIKPFSIEGIRKGWHPPHPGFFFRDFVIDEVGGFDLTFPIVADFDFMLRACVRFSDGVAVLPRIAVFMRSGGASSGGVFRVFRNNVDICRSLEGNGFPVIYWLFIFRRIMSKSFDAVISRMRIRKLTERSQRIVD